MSADWKRESADRKRESERPNGSASYVPLPLEPDDSLPQKVVGAVKNGSEAVAKGLSDAAGSVADFASETADTVSRTAGEYAEATTKFAADAGAAVADKSKDVAKSAGALASVTLRTVESRMREQPWLFAGIALGIGFIIGMRR